MPLTIFNPFAFVYAYAMLLLDMVIPLSAAFTCTPHAPQTKHTGQCVSLQEKGRVLHLALDMMGQNTQECFLPPWRVTARAACFLLPTVGCYVATLPWLAAAPSNGPLVGVLLQRPREIWPDINSCHCPCLEGFE